MFCGFKFEVLYYARWLLVLMKNLNCIFFLRGLVFVWKKKQSEISQITQHFSFILFLRLRRGKVTARICVQFDGLDSSGMFMSVFLVHTRDTASKRASKRSHSSGPEPDALLW
jgi:hypothetical protein